LALTLSPFLFGEEPGRDLEGTGAARITVPPGKYILSYSCLFKCHCPPSIYEINAFQMSLGAKPKIEEIIEANFLLTSPAIKSTQMKLKDRSICRKTWKIFW
jgi:hypothetical protein